MNNTLANRINSELASMGMTKGRYQWKDTAKKELEVLKERTEMELRKQKEHDEYMEVVRFMSMVTTKDVAPTTVVEEVVAVEEDVVILPFNCKPMSKVYGR